MSGTAVNDGGAIITPDGVTLHVATPPAPTPAPTTSRVFTEEEVEAIRRQEKDKLYKSLEDEKERARVLASQLDEFNKEREAAQRLAAEQQAAADEERKRREQEEMDAKSLILAKEDEFNQKLSAAETQWNERLARLEEERDAAALILQKEQEYQQLQSYRSRRLAEEQDNIMPDLIDLVTGNSEAEIDASISALAAKSAAIMDNIQQALPPQRPRGISPLGSTPSGPLDTQTEQQTFSLEQIKAMGNDDWQKYRDRLLQATSPRNRG